MLWLIEAEALPEHDFGPEPENPEDPCHRNLIGISDEDAEDILKQDFSVNQFANFVICIGVGAPQAVDIATITAWQSAHGK